MPVHVEGLRELQAALAKADRETRLGIRRELRHVAEPVQRGAEQNAMTEITGMQRSPKWSGMRVGITRNLVYVAPRKKGTRGRGPRSRPNLADLLMSRAMQPVLEEHTGEIEGRFDEFLDKIADDFNHGSL